MGVDLVVPLKDVQKPIKEAGIVVVMVGANAVSSKDAQKAPNAEGCVMVMAEFVIVVSRIVIAKIEVLGFVQATGEARNVPIQAAKSWRGDKACAPIICRSTAKQLRRRRRNKKTLRTGHGWTTDSSDDDQGVEL